MICPPQAEIFSFVGTKSYDFQRYSNDLEPEIPEFFRLRRPFNIENSRLCGLKYISINQLIIRLFFREWHKYYPLMNSLFATRLIRAASVRSLTVESFSIADGLSHQLEWIFWEIRI